MIVTSLVAGASPSLPPGLAQIIVDDLKKPILVVDKGLQITFANPAFCDLVNLPWRQLNGRSVECFLHNPEIPRLIQESLLRKVMLNLQGRFLIPGVGKRDLLLRIHPIETSQAVFIGLVDVTNAKLSEACLTLRMEAARRGEAAQKNETFLLRQILDSIGDGICVLDPGGNCVLSNPASHKMIDPAIGKIHHREWPERFGLFMQDQKTPFPANDLPLSKALNGEFCDNVEVFVKNATHQGGIWISMTARPLTGDMGAVAAFRDITFAKNVADSLEHQAQESARSNRELEQFAYVAAHDLQEPLRMVSSYVQLLARRYQGKLDAEADEFIGYASDGAKRMSQLINDLLDYSRIGRQGKQDQQVECEKALERAVYSLSEKISSSGAKVTHDPLPRVQANELQFAQLLQNLIDNGIKFRRAQTPHVHISAKLNKDKWLFSVADNGIGIDPQYNERIFVIFQRLHARGDFSGTGIGLAVCKKIVEQGKGSIWVEPNLGNGTIVCFTWPVDALTMKGN